jgi:hypothetical protein
MFLRNKDVMVKISCLKENFKISSWGDKPCVTFDVDRIIHLKSEVDPLQNKEV